MKILVVDDQEGNRHLLEALLTGHGHQVRSARHGAEALEELSASGVELIISDILMPVMDGFQLCRTIKNDQDLCRIFFVFYTATYTGPQDEAFAMQIGADRFLEKPCDPDELIRIISEVATADRRQRDSGEEPVEEERLVLYNERLVLKLEQKMVEAKREIEERKKAETALRESEKRLVDAQRLAGMGDFMWEVASGAVRWSKTLHELLCYDESEDIDYDWVNEKIHHPDDLARVLGWLRECVDSGQDRLTPNEYRVIRRDGMILHVRTIGTIERTNGLAPRVFATVQDITERKQAERRLWEAYQIINMSPVVAFLWKNSPGRPVEFVTDNVADLFGYSLDEFVSGRVSYEGIIHGDDRERVAGEVEQFLRQQATDEHRHEPYRIVTEDGRIKWVDDRSRVRRGEGGVVTHLQGVVIDITEIKSIEAQLFQAQKMESIGRLVGGVAHDYNNMLSVIIGYSELALSRVAFAEPLRDDLQEILAAAGRSRDITRQLLAFARKETICPEVLDLNEAVGSMLKVLRRLVGEDLELAWMPGAGVWPVRMDPAQVDQILANLCVNARDAIADIGKITIETKTVRFDTAYCAEHVGYMPGEFVLLAVADDGCGMERQLVDQIFEPFFTTKEIGRGTGLGLSTVYGIVKQNEGFINVYSEPGQGTIVKIYLPRYQGPDLQEPDQLEVEAPSGQGEMILVVEDEASIMRLTQRILESLDYRVLTAQTTSEALQLAERYTGELALLITDVVMPEMNGRDLAERIQELCPKLACLYMSGFTADIIAHRGVLNQDVYFIQKPFSKKDLAIGVRTALGAG